ncbi:MAG TPA: hypothetical protein VMC83_37295, partial [Streptosporangiaceae bacterium]|nr:hypothetical protein [Streptosporangiaceae bacterium]
VHGDFRCCDRCTGNATAVRASRRRMLKAAVFTAHGESPGPEAERAAEFPVPGKLPRAVTGTVRDVSPHVLVIGNGASETRIALTSEATAWRGAPLEPSGVQPGDQAVVRLHPSRRGVADRIWANVGRVTGVIIERDRDSLLVDEGKTKPRQLVMIPCAASGRIQVRFPNLEPGYLIDVIGVRRPGSLEARIPATSQPAYPVDQMPAPAMVAGRVPAVISGSVTWHEPVEEPPGLLGVSYPALDPGSGCAEDPVRSAAPQFVRMPYLAVGSVLQVRNDCTKSSCTLPVTGCAAIARLFNDRCVTCGTSPRGRVADLTQASFIALGGELERGCFNATITIGR